MVAMDSRISASVPPPPDGGGRGVAGTITNSRARAQLRHRLDRARQHGGVRVNGLVTAGRVASRGCVGLAERHEGFTGDHWLSRMPAPSKPPTRSMDQAHSSGMGAVPGTRMWTRTGVVIVAPVIRSAPAASRGTRPSPVKCALARTRRQLLLERLAGAA